MKKLGDNAYPFFFELPPHCPASVTLQPAPGDTGKPCGIDYELKAFVGESGEDKPHKRNSVRLAIRKVMYAPSKPGEQPSVEVFKEFMMSPSKLHLECSLDKEVTTFSIADGQQGLISICLIISALLPRGDDLGKRAHPEQFKQGRQEDKGVCATVRGHLLILHGAVQMHRRGSGKRVSR